MTALKGQGGSSMPRTEQEKKDVAQKMLVAIAEAGGHDDLSKEDDLDSHACLVLYAYIRGAGWSDEDAIELTREIYEANR